MTCKPEILKSVPLFALLDDDEMAVLAGQVEIKTFAPRQRIYKIGESGQTAYVMISGKVRVSTVDEDHQEVVVDEPAKGEFFGFASMLEQTPHQTNAIAVEESRLSGSVARGHCRSAAAKTDGWHGFADDVGAAVPRFAAIGTLAGQPQPERDHRAGGDAKRKDCRFGRGFWRVLDLYYYVPDFDDGLRAD